MDCEGNRGFAIYLRACDLIRELERKEFGVTDAPCRLTLMGKAVRVCGLLRTEDPAGTAAGSRRWARKVPGGNGADTCRMGGVKRRLLGPQELASGQENCWREGKHTSVQEAAGGATGWQKPFHWSHSIPNR